MILSEELIKEFQEIVKEEYDEDLTLEQASEIGNGLANYFHLLKKAYIEIHKDDKKK